MQGPIKICKPQLEQGRKQKHTDRHALNLHRTHTIHNVFYYNHLWQNNCAFCLMVLYAHLLQMAEHFLIKLKIELLYWTDNLFRTNVTLNGPPCQPNFSSFQSNLSFFVVVVTTNSYIFTSKPNPIPIAHETSQPTIHPIQFNCPIWLCSDLAVSILPSCSSLASP